MFAGHGVQSQGKQTLLTNELAKKGVKFYQLFRVEDKIRALASSYPNTYHLCLFACCRELEKSMDSYNFVTLDYAKNETFKENMRK